MLRLKIYLDMSYTTVLESTELRFRHRRKEYGPRLVLSAAKIKATHDSSLFRGVMYRV